MLERLEPYASKAIKKLTSDPVGIWYVDKDNQTKEFMTFDCVVSEKHDTSSTITKHPVEDGFEVTDHIKRQPRKLVLDTITSNHPITIMASAVGALNAATGGLLDKATFGIGASKSIKMGSKLLTGSKDRSVDVYHTLEMIQENRIPLTVNTHIFNYKNMIITSLSVNRDSKSVESLPASITFEEIRVTDQKDGSEALNMFEEGMKRVREVDDSIKKSVTGTISKIKSNFL